MSDILDRLQSAIGTGELLTIAYDGGSQPGARREVIPLQISGDKVRCRCYTSNGYTAKTFLIAKITILPKLLEKDDESRWTSGKLGFKYATLDDAETAHADALIASGWFVERWRDEDGEGIALFKTTKAGKRLAQPTVMLVYIHTAYDEEFGDDGSVVRTNPRPRTRPWIVRGKPGLKSLGTWRSLDEAVARFLAAAGAV